MRYFSLVLLLASVVAVADDVHYYQMYDFMNSYGTMTYGMGDTAFSDVVHSYGYDVSPSNSDAPFDDGYAMNMWWSPDWTTGIMEVSPETYAVELNRGVYPYHASSPSFSSPDPFANGGGGGGGDSGGVFDGGSILSSFSIGLSDSLFGLLLAASPIVLLGIAWGLFRVSSRRL